MVSDSSNKRVHFVNLSLNPCSNGIWSLTYRGASIVGKVGVLILVLMEYGL